MHTLLIHQAFASPEDGGGTRHYEFARHCVQKGHRFSIVASNLSYLSGERVVDEAGLVTEQLLEGIRVLRAYTTPKLHQSFAWRVIAFLSFMLTSVWAGLRVGRVDLVMGTSPPLFQALSAWFVAVVRRCPFLLEIRDLWPEFAIDIGVLANPVLIRLSRWLEHFMYARATHILINSPAYRDYLISRGVAREKITLIPNGVDPDMFDPAADGRDLRERWGLAGKFVVTYAGALGLANDIETILAAARLLRDEPRIHFLLVGDGKERVQLESTAGSWQLSNVTFLGTQPKSAIADILAASDVCVATLKDIPMFRTTYPNKVFDYMAAGRPTVLAIDGVIRGVVESARSGLFVPPGDSEMLADTIRGMSKDNQLVEELGLSAREYVVEHFNRHKQAEDFIGLVDRLTEQCDD
jgi:glycosyltransferase involved in cell wall biosynthesis